MSTKKSDELSRGTEAAEEAKEPPYKKKMQAIRKKRKPASMLGNELCSSGKALHVASCGFSCFVRVLNLPSENMEV